MIKQSGRLDAELGRTSRMGSRTVRHYRQTLSIAAVAAVCTAGLSAAPLEPPPFDVMNRHQVNMMSGTAAPRFIDLSIGGETGLSHWVTTANSDFVNYEAGYGPLGPRDKFFGRIVTAVHHKPSTNSSTWVVVMRAISFDGAHDFTISPGCGSGKLSSLNGFNTFASYDGDPRHLLEYTSDRKGLVWTRPDGTRVVFDASFSAKQGTCFQPKFTSELAGYGISRIEYPNGFTITGGSAANTPAEVKTNTGFQLTYVYAAKPHSAPDNDLPQESQPWAPAAADPNWSRAVPAYIIAVNNAFDYCAFSPYGQVASAADACPDLRYRWPVASYSWPAGMPRAAYLTDRTMTFSITDAMGRVTNYVHKPFRSTSPSAPEWHVPRLYQVQTATSSDVSVTYDYATSSESQGMDDTMYPIYVSGPAARLRGSTRNGADAIGYEVGARAGQGSVSVNGSSDGNGILGVRTNFTFGTYQIDTWDKTFSFEQQLPNKLTAVRRNTDGVLVEYKYDERYNIREITENGAVVSSAAYPAACTVSTRKTCNKPLWTRDANGNQTDYGYAADSGHTVLVRLPPDKNGVRPETRYDYQPKYAFYLRSAGAQPQRADTPLHVLVRERKCLTGNMNDGGDCSKGSADAVVTEYDYGPEEQPNNLLLRGMTVTAFADGVRQTRRTCYTNDIYGNRIGETRPQAGLNSCY